MAGAEEGGQDRLTREWGAGRVQGRTRVSPGGSRGGGSSTALAEGHQGLAMLGHQSAPPGRAVPWHSDACGRVLSPRRPAPSGPAGASAHPPWPQCAASSPRGHGAWLLVLGGRGSEEEPVLNPDPGQRPQSLNIRSASIVGVRTSSRAPPPPPGRGCRRRGEPGGVCAEGVGEAGASGAREEPVGGERPAPGWRAEGGGFTRSLTPLSLQEPLCLGLGAPAAA